MIRILALGDSYTIGEGVDEVERWPAQLARRLQASGMNVAEPVVIARTGWTTAELAAAIRQANLSGPYDLVSLLIGVNNQYRGLNQIEYQQEFVALLAQAVQFARGEPSRVIVLSIPDWGVTPFAAGRDRAAITADIDAFNAINRAEAVRVGAHYVDVTPISHRAADDADLLAPDGLHPSGKMYALWVEAMLPVVQEAFAEKTSHQGSEA